MKRVIGFGNTIFGDDGFGPRTIEYINENFKLPSDVQIMDGGTATDCLLDEIIDTDTEKLIIVDAYNNGKKPGEISVLGMITFQKHILRD
ncbi:MAG TPA: hydrogenase maturation protease [Candidatus Altiarchaeales archaeon]|nr:hydrogenase maturation protease [Candidatus Altiarchaeales archaeon]